MYVEKNIVAALSLGMTTGANVIFYYHLRTTFRKKHYICNWLGMLCRIIWQKEHRRAKKMSDKEI